MIKFICLVIGLSLVGNVFSQTDSITRTTIDSQNQSSKVEIINKSFDNFVEFEKGKKESKDTIWDTLIPLLIGAALTLVTQFLMDFNRNQKEKKKDILLTKAELEKLKYILKDNYRELAMHKSHKFYWYAHYEFELVAVKPDKNEVDKFYNSHMKSSANVRDTENKIATNFAEYLKQVSKLQYLTKVNDNVRKYIEEYQKFVPQKPKHLRAEKQDDLYKMEREEENKLLLEYQNYILIIEKINDEFM